MFYVLLLCFHFISYITLAYFPYLEHGGFDVPLHVRLADGNEDGVEVPGVVETLNGGPQPLHDGDGVPLQHLPVHLALQHVVLVHLDDLREYCLQLWLRVEQSGSLKHRFKRMNTRITLHNMGL